MSTPTMKGMEVLLRAFKKSICSGVPGVMKIEGPKPGPILGITACTHGNEPSGLAIFHHLLYDLNIKTNLRCGTVYLVVNNVAAAEKFFKCHTEEEWVDHRYVDINMNRLPIATLAALEQLDCEVVRARELHPIWERFTHGLDIHSTLKPTPAMLISRGKNFSRIEKLARGFPVNVLISNIDAVQIGIPAFAFYGGLGSPAPVFAIEAGQHTESATLVRAQKCATSLLQNLKMLEGSPGSEIVEYQEYEMDGSVVFPDMSYEFTKDFNHFDEVRTGDVLARNPEGEEIKAPFDGLLFLPSDKKGEKKDISEEMAFISRPVKIRRVG